jgi:peptidoglycan/LPS O-acetylase OafA/YrhL
MTDSATILPLHQPGLSQNTASAPAVSPLRGHIPELDGIRGFAIVLVMLCHFIPHADHPGSIIGRLFFFMVRAGWSGVDLFFVLSGFLITGILLDDRGDRHYFRNFYARRTLRIFPLYYGLLAVIFLIMPHLWPGPFADPGVAEVRRHQGWLWLYATNIRMTIVGDMDIFRAGWLELNTFWSLAVEEHFYLLWPAIVYLCSRRSLVGVCAAIGVISLATRGWYFHKDNIDAVYVFTLCRADALAAGALLAVLLRTQRLPHILARYAPAATVIFGISWLVSLMIDPARERLWGCTFGYTLCAAFYAALLLWVLTVRPASPLKKTFNFAALRSLGKYSYGIYVYHDLLHNQLSPWFGQRRIESVLRTDLHIANAAYGCSVILYIILAGVASFAVAWISWQVYEKQFLKLKRFFAYHPAKPPAAIQP